MKKILITSYAVNPYKGSEDGTGWNWIYQIARFNHVIAITRENNREHIERYMAENPSRNHLYIQFYYFDLPTWARFWKKGERGALLYFYLWQLFMPWFIKKNKISFDIAHNLNFHNDWIPSFLWILQKPLVWGPIGHHPPIKSEYLQKYPFKERIKDVLKYSMKRTLLFIDPFIRICRNRAEKILAVNRAVERFHKNAIDKILLLPAVGATKPIHSQVRKTRFIVLSSGRFVPLKGFDLTILAFAKFYDMLNQEEKKNVGLQLLGKGPLESYLKHECKTHKIEHSVEFMGWLPMEKVSELYAQSSVFLFPSHEGAGMVIPEALSYGLPVICFDNPGPGDMVSTECGIKVSYKQYSKSVEELSMALLRLYKNQEELVRMSLAAKEHFNKFHDWNTKGDLIKTIYENIR